MRLIVSSPDGIGDFVLREPLWAELTAAGATLLLLTRPTVRSAAESIVPGARVLEIPLDAYRYLAAPEHPALPPLAEELRSFEAERIVIAPYVHTWFDEWLCAQLADVPAIGFAGRKAPGSVASLPARLVARFNPAVKIAIESRETEKCHRLAEAILGRSVAFRSPRLCPKPEAQQTMRERLVAAGWGSEPFHLACVGDGPRNRSSNWPSEQWAKLLRHAHDRYGWRFVLIGNEEERATNQKIQYLCNLPAQQLLRLDDPLLSYDQMTALLSLASGYVGRDTGPMHMAAALGKPVFALFGGGAWPRFLPAAEVGAALTLSVVCAGCLGACHLPTFHCIKDLPLESVMAAFDRLATGEQRQFEAHVLPRSAELVELMEREAALAGREAIYYPLIRKQLAAQCSAASTPPRRVHIGHHFFGAGNLGDDLMVSGFLHALFDADENLQFTCPVAFDVASQQLRFPQIEWMNYEQAQREASIRDCDAWLGLGDTPFQVDSGPWFLDHLDQERRWCEQYGKPMYFLSVGVNNRAAVTDPRGVALLQTAKHIWARDRHCAELLAEVAGAEKVSLAADLAHIYLASVAPPTTLADAIGWTINFEDASLFDCAALEQAWDGFPLRTMRQLWQVQEVRKLPGTELEHWEALNPRRRALAELQLPDYNARSVSELIGTWTAPAIRVSSRYHALVLGAWQGSRLVSLVRNEKLAGIADDLEITCLAPVRDAEKLIAAVAASTPVSRDRLQLLAGRARKACREFFAAVRALNVATETSHALESETSHAPESETSHALELETSQALESETSQALELTNDSVHFGIAGALVKLLRFDNISPRNASRAWREFVERKFTRPRG